MPKTKNAERIKAINLYNSKKYSFKEIAKKLNVRPNTVGDWFKRYESQMKLTEELEQLRVLVNTELDKKNPKYSKINSLINSLNKKISILDNKQFK